MPELRSLTRQHPTRERMWAQLIVALHRCDRQTEALRAYDDIRGRLAGELGLDPGKDLQLALGDRAAAVRYGEEADASAERLGQPRALAVTRRILATAATSTAPAAPAS